MHRLRLFALFAALTGCLSPVREPLPPGSVEPACSHATCSGCCDQGVCVSGYDDDACGLLGRTCDVCNVADRCDGARRCMRGVDAGSQEWTPYSAPSPAVDPNAPADNNGPPARCGSAGSSRC